MITMKSRTMAVIACFLALWVLAGCVGIEPTATAVGGGTQQATPTRIIASGQQAPTPEEKKVSVLPQADTAIAAARADLAKRLGVAAETIEVAVVTKTDWSDTSLGCPQPGYMYAQVITPGYKIILKAQDKEYEYHTDDQGSSVVLCQKG